MQKYDSNNILNCASHNDWILFVLSMTRILDSWRSLASKISVDFKKSILIILYYSTCTSILPKTEKLKMLKLKIKTKLNLLCWHK